jgi:DNA sulfur modification protein DndD
MSLGKNQWDTASVLGLSVYQGVLDDLKWTLNELQERILVIEHQSGITDMRTKIKAIKMEIKGSLGAIANIQKEIKEVNELEKKLQKIRSFAEKYSINLKKLKLLNDEIKDLGEKLKYAQKKARLGMQMAPYAIIKEHLINALAFVEHMKELTLEARFKQGRLDAQMEILEEIYEGEKCICGNPLASSKYGKKSISSLLNELENDIKRYDKAAKAEYWPNLELMEMRSRVDLGNMVSKELNNHLLNIAQHEKILSQKMNERKVLNKKEKELELQVQPTLDHVAIDKVKWYYLSKIDRIISKHERKKGIHEGRIAAYKEMIKIKRKNIKELKNVMMRTLASEKTRMENIKDTQKRMRKMYSVVENALNRAITEVLQELEKKVKEIFKKITNKPKEFLSVEFSSADGTPYIITNDGKELTMSQISDGERQIVMFSLMSALKYMSPAEALIVDAPFGRLDSKHIKSVVNFLPAMAAQTILLITDREFQEIHKSGIKHETWHIIKENEDTKLKVVA